MALLGQAPISSGYYLAGGTALALHFGHRRSVDLDFFSRDPFESEGLATLLGRMGNIRIERSEAGTFRGQLAGVQISFIRYDYPLLDPPIKPDFGPRVAGIRDIACMKLAAIMGRGSRRDFVDLYAVCQHGRGLEEVYEWFRQKYQGISYDPYHLVKSLVYFVDADKEPMPDMISPCPWDEVKAFFASESQRMVKG